MRQQLLLKLLTRLPTLRGQLLPNRGRGWSRNRLRLPALIGREMLRRSREQKRQPLLLKTEQQVKRKMPQQESWSLLWKREPSWKRPMRASQ